MKRLLKELGILLMIVLASHVVYEKATNPSDSSIRSRIVMLKSERGSCSAEQIQTPSGKDLIISAAHCLPLAKNGMVEVVSEDGTKLMRKIIAEDPQSDLLLIEGMPNLKGLKIAPHSHKHQHVRTFTHGSGYDTYKTEGVLVQNAKIQIGISEVSSPEDEAACRKMPKNDVLQSLFGSICIINVEEMASTAKVVPGSSGGAVLNDAGELVGVVSATDNSGSFSYFVRLIDIQAFLQYR